MKEKKIIGLQRKKVRISSYNSEWKKIYKKEKELLFSVLGDQVLDIQHIGSTSVPGVKSKPIIDIVVVVKKIKDAENLIESVEKLGYEYKHEAGVRGRRFFVKGSEKNRTHYIHMVKLDGKQWKNLTNFREYLLEDKKNIKEYNELKESLAKEYKDDRDTYTKKKSIFISRAIKKFEKKIK
jgi:GrpB-like predicted nucleotidyltransferase (UPF0157 family)